MQKFCPNLELTRLIYRISTFLSNTQKHKRLSIVRKAPEQQAESCYLEIFMSTKEAYPKRVKTLDPQISTHPSYQLRHNDTIPQFLKNRFYRINKHISD